MEIRDARSPLLAVPFSNLKPGETFIRGENLYLRTLASPHGNCVNLKDGRMFSFSTDEEVIPVKAYVVKEA